MLRLPVLLSLIFLLSACGTPQVSTPAPTAQAIGVTYPPALQPWADKLSGCAIGNPRVALFFNPSNSPGASILANDIVLELGQPAANEAGRYLSQVGSEQIVVIVNKANPLEQLSNDEAGLIFAGQQSTWSDGSGQPIQLWALPDGDPARRVFDQTILPTQPLTTQAMLAPDPTAMLQAISQNPNSIGYLPASFLNATGSVNPSDVHIVQLEQSAETALHQPVVAITQGEPVGLLRSLLVCLQADTP